MQKAFADKLILITGASSGLGRALALQLGGQGADLALVARRQKELAGTSEESIKAGACRVECFPFDLSKFKGISTLVSSVEKRFDRPVDILIHAAGAQSIGYLDELPLEAVENIFSVNVLSAIALVQAVAPAMKEKSSGAIVLISSGMAYWGVSGMSVYSASKAAIERIAESLRAEYQGHGIGVSVISPGPMDTPMFRNPPIYGKYQAMPVGNPVNADAIARKIVNKLSNPANRIELSFRSAMVRHFAYWVPGLLNKLFQFNNRKNGRLP